MDGNWGGNRMNDGTQGSVNKGVFGTIDECSKTWCDLYQGIERARDWKTIGRNGGSDDATRRNAAMEWIEQIRRVEGMHNI